ncbi:MAG: hypothetical protein R3B13_21880 [Polyangiaceae bacterium]
MRAFFPRNTVKLGLLCSTLLVTSACARQKPATEAPAGPAPDLQQAPGTNLDQLEAELAAAERQLTATLPVTSASRAAKPAEEPAPAAQPEDEDGSKPTGGQEARPGASVVSKPTTSPAPPPTPAPKTEEAAGSAGLGASQQNAIPSCDTACKALSSMERSADRICEITGEADERCTRARGRVGSASERVKSSGCTCASDDND